MRASHAHLIPRQSRHELAWEREHGRCSLAWPALDLTDCPMNGAFPAEVVVVGIGP